LKTKETIETDSLVRYSMNFVTYRRLMNDHIRFRHSYTAEFKSNFLCRILTNYLCYIQKTDKSRFDKNVENSLTNKKNLEYFQSGRLSVTAALAKKIKEFSFYNNKNFKKSTVISFALESFASMPFTEREKIYFYGLYCSLMDFIKESQMIHLEYKEKGNINDEGNKKYEVIPYDIVVDDNSFSYYLIGHAAEEKKESPKMICSFKISRIVSCRSLYDTCSLDEDTNRKINNRLAKFGAAYVEDGDDPEEIVIRLSQKGYGLFLTSIARQRPVPKEEPKPDAEKPEFYILKFDCSYAQIRNYFFSFGGEAEVLSPTELRDRFISDYSKALEHYNTST